MAPRNTFAATRRSHHILEWLQKGEDVTIQRICDEFGIQYPQARADLKLLEELYQLSTYRDGRTKVWKWSTVSPHVTFATAAALEFGGIALDIFQGTPYGEEIDRMTAYCRERVGRSQTGRLDRLSHALHLRRTWFPEDNEQMIDHIETILDAFQLEKPIEFIYERNADGKVQTYKAYPRNLIWYNGRLWLLAQNDGQDKTFDVAAITRIKMLRKEDPVELDELDPEDHFKDSFGIFGGDGFEVRPIVLEVSGSWANYLRRYRLHPSQEIKEIEDGRLRVGYRMGVCPEFKSFLISMIPHVRVVLPDELRLDLEDRARAWLTSSD
jgi:predicted DNA-binding transcriptional regulator YafY